MQACTALVLVVVLSVILCGCPTNVSVLPPYVALEEPEPVDVDGPFKHAYTGVVFPLEHAGFDRVSVTRYDENSLRVGVGYVKQVTLAGARGVVSVNVSVYVYPSRGPVEAELVSVGSAIEGSYEQVVKIGSSRYVLENSGGEFVGVWSRYHYRVDVGLRKDTQESDSYLFPIWTDGQLWTMKYRISYPADFADNLRPAVEAFLKGLSLPK